METGPLLNLEKKKNILEPQKNKWHHKFAFLSHFEIFCIKRDSELFLCVVIMVTYICYEPYSRWWQKMMLFKVTYLLNYLLCY